MNDKNKTATTSNSDGREKNQCFFGDGRAVIQIHEGEPKNLIRVHVLVDNDRIDGIVEKFALILKDEFTYSKQS